MCEYNKDTEEIGKRNKNKHKHPKYNTKKLPPPPHHLQKMIDLQYDMLCT